MATPSSYAERMLGRPLTEDRGRLTPRALAVTRHLVVNGPASRGHIGQDLSLSEASMSRVARTLVQDGLITENSDPSASPTNIGRPRQLLAAVPSARHVIGVKLTADTAYGVACDLLGSVAQSEEAPLPTRVGSGLPVPDTIEVIAGLVRRLAAQVPTFDGVGVSVGGIVSRRAVRHGTFLGWHDIPLAELLEAAIGAPVVVTNDVTALAREQLWFGAGRTHSTFGVITVGAGLGFGVVREGQVVEQLIDNGHLLSHTPVTGTAGPTCDLGHHGCVAAYLYRGEVEHRVHTDGRPATGRPASVFAEDPVRADAARAVAHLTATFAGALQTERIVLAGEDVDHLVDSPVYAETLASRLRDETGGPRLELDVSVEPSGFADWARGAAVVGIQHILGAL